MKTYKELTEEILSEGHNRYPGDDMTMKELKIAANAAKNIIEMLEDGAELQRWQISAIVVASDELASVCTSMRVDYDEEMEDEIEYGEYDYPSMYGEALDQLDELSPETLGSYASKASKDLDRKKNMWDRTAKVANKRYRDMNNREKGIKTAIDKLTRTESAGEEYLDEGILKSYHSIANKPWSETLKRSKNTVGEYKQIAKGKDFTVWTGYSGSIKRQSHYVVKDDKIVGSGWTMASALKDAKLKDSDLVNRSKFADGSILNKGMKEEVKLNENEDSRKNVIGDAIKKYADDAGNAKEIRGVSVNKIIDAFASKKVYGNKSIDELESELGLPDGVIIKLIAKVKENLKLNYNVKASGAQTQAKRIGSYLKQKHIGPIKR